MKINDGLLDTAEFIKSPNYDDRSNEQDMSLIVIHNISLPPGEFNGPWITRLFTNDLPVGEHPFFAEIHHLRVSSHLLIRREGEVIQYVPFHKRAWHAGVSEYLGRSVCNDFSVGIELEGTDEVPFTTAQYDALASVLQLLVKTYSGLSMENITGHEHIAPGRKTDPGPYFDWNHLGRLCDVSLPAHARSACSDDV